MAGLTVCVPATGEMRRLPVPPHAEVNRRAALRLRRRRPPPPRMPFRVVLVGTTTKDGGVYSSEDAAWSEADSPEHLESPVCLESVPGVLVGNGLHFLFQDYSILGYDLGSRQMSVIQRPPQECTYYQGRPLLMRMEDGRLGFASVNQSALSLWPREVGADGEARWGQRRVIGLETLLSHEDLLTLPYLLGFSDEVGVLFLWTAVGGLFSIDLKSGRVENFEIDMDIFCVLPFVSYCIPALGAASADEESRASSSSA